MTHSFHLLTRSIVLIALALCSLLSAQSQSAINYCLPEMTPNVDITITRFKLADSDQYSGQEGYADFMSQIVIIVPGETYQTEMNLGQSTNQRIKIWIDLNDDGSFEEGENIYNSKWSRQMIKFNMTVPEDLALGIHRMRVMNRFNYDYDACLSGEDGEAEDYLVAIELPNQKPELHIQYNGKDCTMLTHDFGALKQGTEKESVFTLFNKGDGTLSIAKIESTQPEAFSIEQTDLSIAPGDSMDIEIKFQAVNPKITAAQLHFVTNDSSMAEFTIDLTGAVLVPPHVSKMRADVSDTDVTVFWEADSSVVKVVYTIEKSIDGKEFMKVANIDGENSQKRNAYDYLDEFPFMGTSYYRVKQTDQFEDVIYSEIKSVELEVKVSVEVFPNPVWSQTELNVSATYFGELTFVLYDFSGKPVANKAFQQSTKVFIPKLGAGIYVYQIKHGKTVVESGKLSVK